MKKVLEILQTNLLQRPMIRLTFALMLYTAILVFLEYRFHLKRDWVNSRFFYSDHWWKHFLFYAIPMIGTIPIWALFRTGTKVYWGSALVFLLVVAAAFTFSGSFKFHRELAYSFESYAFGVSILNNIFTGPAMMLLPVLWWMVVEKKGIIDLPGNSLSSQRFYGTYFRNTDFKAYLSLLVLMIPLIAFASMQGDFLSYYPKAGRIFSEDELGKPWQYGLYELLYGLDFVYIEFFFRGFLVIGLARFIGKDAIPLAAVFYCTIHFGKPLGETISSFFGGMILGTLALETGSVLGGIIVHIGIAWMMELGGWIGKG